MGEEMSVELERCRVRQVEATLPIGTVIRERYAVEAVLGTGNFGPVYLVRDQRDRQNLFVVKERVGRNKLERDHFIFACVILRQLHHPALVHVYRVFEDDKLGRAYMLMQYIQGPDLETLRHRRLNKRFSLSSLLPVMAPVVDAITYLHLQNPPIVHRDIKPANIIVSAENKGVLVNFGIDTVASPNETFSGAYLCSPCYGAPEQYKGESDPRTDIYGLGATLYTLLTGIIPPDARERMAQLASTGTDPLMKVHQVAVVVPGVISAAIHRAISVNSEDRFATVEEFWHVLNAVAISQQLPVPAPSPIPEFRSTVAQQRTGTPVPARRSQKRSFIAWLRRLGVVLLLAVMLVTSVAIGKTLWSRAKSNQSSGSVVRTPGSVHTVIPSHSTPSTNSLLASAYTGTIHNIAANVTTTISLTRVQESKGQMNGYLILGPELSGSGFFKGNISDAKHITFIVTDVSGQGNLSFEGAIQRDGNIAGSYCRLSPTGQCADEFGVWSVSPVPEPGRPLRVP
jgi:serine/threonine protein kinase